MLTEIFEKLPGKLTAYGRNSLLFDIGNKVSRVFLVKSGSFGLFTEVSGKEHIIRLAYPGSFLFAPDSFFASEPTQYFAKALKKSEVISVEKDDILDYFSDKEDQIHIIYQQIILDLCERELDLLCHSSSERFKRLLERSPQVFQHIPHKYIASYLRISPETLSRLKKS